MKNKIIKLNNYESIKVNSVFKAKKTLNVFDGNYKLTTLNSNDILLLIKIVENTNHVRFGNVLEFFFFNLTQNLFYNDGFNLVKKQINTIILSYFSTSFEKLL